MSRFKNLTSTLLVILTVWVIGLFLFQNRTYRSLKELKNQDQTDVSADVSVNSNQPPTDIAGLVGDTTSSLQASLSSLLSRIEKLETTPETTSTPTTTTSVSTPAFQPQVIYVGSASLNKRQWTDSGVEVIINSANYPADVNVVFQAGLSIPGGEAWARLRNKTTGAVILASEIMHNNSTVTWKGSSIFKLHNGNYNYVVQIRSTSGETVNLAGARLNITK